MNSHAEFLADKTRLPEWFDYPPGVRSLVEHGAVNFTPWHLVKVEFALEVYSGHKKRYGRELFPVAYRQGSDDTLCVEKGGGNTVIIINGYAVPGRENIQEFASFWDWFRYAVEDLINFHYAG